MHTIAISLFVAAPALVSAAATLHKRIGGYGTYYYTQTGNACVMAMVSTAQDTKR